MVKVIMHSKKVMDVKWEGAYPFDYGLEEQWAFYGSVSFVADLRMNVEILYIIWNIWTSQIISGGWITQYFNI